MQAEASNLLPQGGIFVIGRHGIDAPALLSPPRPKLV